ncbi:MAG: STAS/SEC14 domain-containing protein [Bacteroidota bacterium]
MSSFDGKYVYLVNHEDFVDLRCKTDFISLEIVEEMIRERLEFTNHREVYLYCDVTRVKEVEKQARDYLGTEKGTVKLKGIAIFVNSTLTKFIANFIIKVSYKDSPIPIRLFADRQKAIDWLSDLKRAE